MSAQAQPALAPLPAPQRVYLDKEREAQQKHEFFDGEIVAMAGASYRHNLLVSAVIRELGNQLRGQPCRAVASDLRVASGASYTYPDVVVHCGEPIFTDDHLDTLTNPRVLMEVLSESTEARDRGEKFRNYRLLESLQEYVLISQERVLVELYRRQGQLWVLSEFRALDDVVSLDAISCRLRLSDIYENDITEAE